MTGYRVWIWDIWLRAWVGGDFFRKHVSRKDIWCVDLKSRILCWYGMVCDLSKDILERLFIPFWGLEYGESWRNFESCMKCCFDNDLLEDLFWIWNHFDTSSFRRNCDWYSEYWEYLVGCTWTVSRMASSEWWIMSLSVVLFEDNSPENGYEIQWDSSFGGVLELFWSCFAVLK